PRIQRQRLVRLGSERDVHRESERPLDLVPRRWRRARGVRPDRAARATTHDRLTARPPPGKPFPAGLVAFPRARARPRRFPAPHLPAAMARARRHAADLAVAGRGSAQLARRSPAYFRPDGTGTASRPDAPQRMAPAAVDRRRAPARAGRVHRRPADPAVDRRAAPAPGAGGVERARRAGPGSRLLARL